MIRVYDAAGNVIETHGLGISKGRKVIAPDRVLRPREAAASEASPPDGGRT
jgi:hypothetical protein